MDGITIITERLCRAFEIEPVIILGVVVTLICCVCLWALRFMYMLALINTKKRKILMTISLIVIVAAYIGFWVAILDRYNTTYIEYTVTVDDSVSFNDFYTKYEIISVNGNEYRVVEK